MEKIASRGIWRDTLFILFNDLPELFGGECFHSVQNIPAANIVRRMGSKIKSSDRTEEIRSVFWLLGFCLMQPAPLWIILLLRREIETSSEFLNAQKSCTSYCCRGLWVVIIFPAICILTHDPGQLIRDGADVWPLWTFPCVEDGGFYAH